MAVAGRRGLCHYSSNSGRWKLFADELQEQAFIVRGGLLWFHHVLIAAVELSKTYQVGLAGDYLFFISMTAFLDPSILERLGAEQPKCAT